MTPKATTVPMSDWLEQAWLDRYVERALDGEDLEWFEAYMLDKPHLLETVSADLALRDAANAAPAGVVPAQASAQHPTLTLPAPRPAAGKPRTWRPALAMAASLAIAFVSGLLVRGSARQSPDELLIASPTRLVVDISRGDATETGIDNGSATSDLIVIDALVPPDATSVMLRGAGITERALAVSRDGVVTFLLRRRDISRLAPLSLSIKSGGRQYEARLPIDKLNQTGGHR